MVRNTLLVTLIVNFLTEMWIQIFYQEDCSNLEKWKIMASIAALKVLVATVLDHSLRSTRIILTFREATAIRN